MKEQINETPLQKRTRLRIEQRQEMLAFLHRKPSDCGLDVAQHVADAADRMKKPKFEKDEYTPPRPENWVTAYHVGNSDGHAKHKAKRSKNCKRVNDLNRGVQRKDWGKSTASRLNRHVKSAASWRKMTEDKQYSR